MPHSWQSPPEYGAARALVVQFTPDMLENIGLSLPEFAPIKKLLDRCSAGLSFGADEKTASLLRKTVHTGGLESLLSLIETLRHLSCLSSLPITVASASRPKNRQDCDNINRLFNYINENYTSPITLAGAAKIACKSESAFCRFFKQISGTTFMEHVNDLRVSLACRLLRETDKPITEICFEAGFSNIANFNRQFKKRKNQSPRQYRSENKHI
jgi:AraC-like DNA-binding protein